MELRRNLKIIFLSSLLAAAVAGCGQKGKDNSNEGPTQRAEDVIISESEMGQSKWLLTTKTADYYDEEQKVVMTDPKLINKTDCTED